MPASSQTTDNVTSLLGSVRDTYANEIKDIRVQEDTLAEMFPPDTKAMFVGNQFHLPLIVGQSHSVTFGAQSSFQTLNTPTAPASIDALIPSREMSFRMIIPYGMLAEAEKDSVSFVTKASLQLIALDAEGRREREWSMLYGQAAVAQNSAFTPSGASGTGTWLAGTWAPAYISGAENQPFDIYSAIGGTKRNANAAVLLTVVDPIAGTFTVTGNSTDMSAIQATDVWVRFGETNANTMVGVATQLANTTATLFTNMNPAAWNILKGNVISSVGVLSFEKLLKYVANAKHKGLKGEAAVLLGPDGFSAMANQLSSLRRFDGSYEKGKLTNGAETIQVRAGGVTMDIVEHLFIKQGEVYCAEKDSVYHPAVSDLTDSINGLKLEVMSAGSTGFEFRLWTSSQPVIARPGAGFQLTGVTFPQ